MLNRSQRLRRKSDAFLGEGEEILGAAFVQPPGSMSRSVQESGGSRVSGNAYGSFVILGSIIRGVVRSRQSKAEAAPPTLAGRVPRRNVVLTLTNERIVWVKPAFGGGSGQALAQHPLSEVSSTFWNEIDELDTTTLALGFTDGSGASVWISHSEKPAELRQAFSAFFPEPGTRQRDFEQWRMFRNRRDLLGDLCRLRLDTSSDERTRDEALRAMAAAAIEHGFNTNVVAMVSGLDPEELASLEAEQFGQERPCFLR